MCRLPDISHIKRQHEITQVVGRYLSLNRQGKEWVGLCPFHDDHHPSLQVSSSRQSYICYACGAKGDVIAFVQAMEKCTFPEAVEKLSPGSPTRPLQRGGEKRKEAPPSGELRGLLGLLMPYSTGVPELTPAYLEFETGVAPHLLPSRWKAMAGRLVFPIYDEHGQLAGYAGRSLLSPEEGAGAASPRYLNTPGLPRSQLLYGLHRAKDTIRREGTLYLVEGFKDVIALHAAGLTGTVGLCGTQLAEGQRKLVSRYAEKVVLVLDGDEAGQTATRTVTALLRQDGLETVAVTLPPGTDPDSLFREWGGSRLAAYIRLQSCAPPLSESLLLAALLRWPVEQGAAGRERVPRIALVQGILREEELLFESEEYGDLLDEYATLSARSPHPDGTLLTYRQEGSPLEILCGEELDNRLLSLRQEGRLREEEAVTTLVSELFVAYCQTRLVRLLQTLARRLAAGPTPDIRRPLLCELARRRSQLTTVSELLHTAGAVL
ncbi:MAG: CHC2 zinc finger domain-containing protein [Tannerellaceae bacterium]|nr:CHC2 zinc finger domain-containing protein [Tannerellaceae bacterium]